MRSGAEDTSENPGSITYYIDDAYFSNFPFSANNEIPGAHEIIIQNSKVCIYEE